MADPDALNRTVDAARRLRELDAQIDIAVLEESGGLSQNYDTLTRTFREMHRLETQVATSPSAADPTVKGDLARVKEHVRTKEEIVESFQSANAVLRNSSAYLPIIATDATDAADGDSAVTALLASVILCRIDCNAEVIARIEADIARVAALPPDPDTALVLVHARVFATHAPRVEQATRRLSAMSGEPFDDLYVSVRSGREAAIVTANHYRIGLIALTVALLVAVAGMLWRLRALNETLEARVAARTRELSESREEYKALAAEGRMLEAELRAAQKLESLGRLSAGIAHEINTPVQFVSDSVHFLKEAFTSIVEDDVADKEYAIENVPEALDSALSGLGRIATIVKSLNEFARPDQSEKTDVDLNASIQSTLTIATTEYKDVADIRLELGEVGPVLCHGDEINQVVLNLIVNAAHAVAETNQRGTIEIRTWQDADWVHVSVKDSGPGIPEAIRDKIFDPFFTTKEVGKGAGQSLALGRRIVVDKHGGDLGFETETGIGTTFTLTLPRERPALAA